MKRKDSFPWKNRQHSLQILDGAWATQWIAEEGFQGQCFDAYNILYPDKVQKMASNYVQAGSDIILTNTFQSSSIALKRSGWDREWEKMNRLGVQLSQAGAQEKAWVFASMGPPFLDKKQVRTQKNNLWESVQSQALVLIEAGADAIVLESFTDLIESRWVTEAVLEVAGNFPVGLSGCFGYGERGLFSPVGKGMDRGVSLEEFLETFASYPLFFWGANCGATVSQTREFLPFFQAYDRPIWLKPGMGTPIAENGAYRYPLGRQVSWELLVQPGVCFLGGCCGTSPEEIKCLATYKERANSSVTPNVIW